MVLSAIRDETFLRRYIYFYCRLPCSLDSLKTMAKKRRESLNCWKNGAFATIGHDGMMMVGSWIDHSLKIWLSHDDDLPAICLLVLHHRDGHLCPCLTILHISALSIYTAACFHCNHDDGGSRYACKLMVAVWPCHCLPCSFVSADGRGWPGGRGRGQRTFLPLPQLILF